MQLYVKLRSERLESTSFRRVAVHDHCFIMSDPASTLHSALCAAARTLGAVIDSPGVCWHLQVGSFTRNAILGSCVRLFGPGDGETKRMRMNLLEGLY